MDKRVLRDLKESYGLSGCSFSRVNGGYKNELWRVETKEKPLLVKMFSPERFSERKIENINTALLRQQAAHEKGVPCPQVYLYEGKAIRYVDTLPYMVMDFCAGHNEKPATITLLQLQSIGEALGNLHAAFAQMPVGNAIGYAREPDKLLESLLALADKRADVADIARTWSLDELRKIPSGLAHEDMTADNVLFDDQGVTAIIDFDRCCYGYPLHDVGRALLSFTLTQAGFDLEKVRAFAAGYGRFLPLQKSDIVRSLMLTWLIEAPWWLHDDDNKWTGKARRFCEEILYLTAHYAQLADAVKMD